MGRKIFKFRKVPLPCSIASSDQEQRRSHHEHHREQRLWNKCNSQEFHNLKQIMRTRNHFKQSSPRNPVLSIASTSQSRQQNMVIEITSNSNPIQRQPRRLQINLRLHQVQWNNLSVDRGAGEEKVSKGSDNGVGESHFVAVFVNEQDLGDAFEEMEEEEGNDEEDSGGEKEMVRDEEERERWEGESREVTEKHGGTWREVEFGIWGPEFGVS